MVLLTEVGDYYNGDHSLANMDQYKWYQIRTNGEGNVIEAKEASILNTQTGSRYVTEYDKINDKVEEAAARLGEIIRAAKCTPVRNESLLQQFLSEKPI